VFTLISHKTVKSTPEQAMKAHRRSGGTTPPWLDRGTERGRIAPEIEPVPIVQEAGWVPGGGVENRTFLDPTRFRNPDCPARSKPLYRPRFSMQ